MKTTIGSIQSLLVLCLAFILGSLVSRAYSQSFLTQGLVAYYPFNGNANDASGNGHNGTVYGATPTTNRFGAPKAAYYFDGVSAYITASVNNTVFGGDFTVSMWYNAYDTASYNPTLMDAEPGNSYYSFLLEFNANGTLLAWANFAGGPATDAMRYGLPTQLLLTLGVTSSSPRREQRSQCI